MRLPWSQKEKIDELEEEIEKLEKKLEDKEDEKESFRNRFEAEKERRSELASKKQEAEKELKKLKQKNKQKRDKSRQEETSKSNKEQVSLKKAERILDKVESVKSPENDLVTVYSPESLRKVSDLKGLKNSVSKEEYRFLKGERFAAFMDPDITSLKLKTRPFFSPKWKVDNSFEVEVFKEFIEEEKQWAAVSAGKTQIIREKGGEILEKEGVSSRVNRKQKKGGFSQGRFERKRDKQIDEHLNQVEKHVTEDTLLVGEERLCKKLPGRHLGGFDEGRGLVNALYGFSLERMR